MTYGIRQITFNQWQGSIYTIMYYNEKARIVQSGGGYNLMFPPADKHAWQTEGLPINKTDNSSLKESLSTGTALFEHHRSNGGWTAFR